MLLVIKSTDIDSLVTLKLIYIYICICIMYIYIYVGKENELVRGRNRGNC